MAPSPPGLHSLIDCRRPWWSAGSAFVFSIYNAPVLQKSPLETTVSSLYSNHHQHPHSQKIKLTHQRRGQPPHQGFSAGISLFEFLSRPCPLPFFPFGISQFLMYPGYPWSPSWQFAYLKLPIKPRRLSAAFIFFPATRIHHSWQRRTKGGWTAGGWFVCWGRWCVRCKDQVVTVELPYSPSCKARPMG